MIPLYFTNDAAWRLVLRWPWYIIRGRVVAHAMFTPTDDEFRLRSLCGQSATYASNDLEACAESDVRFKANTGLASYICEQCVAEIAIAGARHQIHGDTRCSIRRSALRALRNALSGENQ